MSLFQRMSPGLRWVEGERERTVTMLEWGDLIWSWPWTLVQFLILSRGSRLRLGPWQPFCLLRHIAQHEKVLLLPLSTLPTCHPPCGSGTHLNRLVYTLMLVYAGMHGGLYLKCHKLKCPKGQASPLSISTGLLS